MTANTNMLNAIAWCLAWGDQRIPNPEFQSLRELLQSGSFNAAAALPNLPDRAQALLNQVQTLQAIDTAALHDSYPHSLDDLSDRYSDLSNQPAIGLVLGGATKIKQYVFESANLQTLRGASALLDRINLIDLPSFFNPAVDSTVRPWFATQYPDLANALIPELVIYSTGGNILAFCPAAFVHDLANAIEQCYTRETLTANSAAVGDTFQLLELRFGRLCQPWLDTYLANLDNPIVQALFDRPLPPDADADPLQDTDYIRQFCDRKTFSELTTQLATRFNQRRSGNVLLGRPRPRAYPPMFETHAYLQRDGTDRRSAIDRITELPSNPKFSEATARKYIMGQISKRDTRQDWWSRVIGDWQPGNIKSWVQKFLEFLPTIKNAQYGQGVNLDTVEEARSLREIGASGHPRGYVAYIYADGNNMGGYIQNQIKTPEAYQQFSDDVSAATEQAVYHAIAQYLDPTWYTPDRRSDRENKKDVRIHPFEILTIGGDDVLLIVPADKAIALTKTLCETFERILCQRNPHYRATQTYAADQVHRYRSQPPSETDANPAQCQLSMSAGVLITSDNTPVYYADRLVSQLLKSAKRKAKALKSKGYLGGTIDFLTLKSVTMISSNIDEFRAQGLTRERDGQPTLKFYGAPYTLYEIDGLLKTVAVLHTSGLPRSQIYQIRSLLEQGKKTSMLNYRYFRARLKDKGNGLDTHFDKAWCWAQSNDGTLSPWRCVSDRTYETIWRELVDLYSIIPSPDTAPSRRRPSPSRAPAQSR
jgi:CRISPR-associated protein Cmr2